MEQPVHIFRKQRKLCLETWYRRRTGNGIISLHSIPREIQKLEKRVVLTRISLRRGPSNCHFLVLGSLSSRHYILTDDTPGAITGTYISLINSISFTQSILCNNSEILKFYHLTDFNQTLLSFIYLEDSEGGKI